MKTQKQGDCSQRSRSGSPEQKVAQNARGYGQSELGQDDIAIALVWFMLARYRAPKYDCNA